jgi:hypothetical protein
MIELANPQVEDSLRDLEVQHCSIQPAEFRIEILRSWSPFHWLSGTSGSGPCTIGRFHLLLFDDCPGDLELDQAPIIYRFWACGNHACWA